MNIIRHVGGINGRFVAQCPFGEVVRTVEYPDFVYHHPDGRTARHGIGAGVGTPRRPIDFIEIDERGVHFCNTSGIARTIPWE